MNEKDNIAAGVAQTLLVFLVRVFRVNLCVLYVIDVVLVFVLIMYFLSY
jgi:hypothetical protein